MFNAVFRRSAAAWQVLLIIVSMVAFSCHAPAEQTIDGFITKSGEPTEFYIGSLNIQIDGTTRCATEVLQTSIYIPHGSLYPPSLSRSFKMHADADPSSRQSVPCSRIAWSVGTHVEVVGESELPGRHFRARNITAYLLAIHLTFAQDVSQGEWRGAALIEEPPQISASKGGWTGILWLDGYPLTVTPQTETMTAPVGSEPSYRPFRFLEDPHWGAVMPKSPVPQFSASLFQPNTWAIYSTTERNDSESYHASSADDESVHRTKEERYPIKDNVYLQQIRLWPNQISQEEKAYTSQFTPTVHPPDYGHRIPGTIVFGHRDTRNGLRIVPSRAAQEYMSKLGQSLVPDYQQRLALNDQTKIEFRFYVVQDAKPRANDEMSRADAMVLTRHKDLNRGVIALPDGLILVPDYMVARLGNEAQLATLLSCAIASVLQRQGFITRGSRPWNNAGDSNPGNFSYPIHGFIYYLLRNEQMLRLGVRQLYLAGYDIRESPLAWAFAASRPITNPLPSVDHKISGMPWYVAYTFDYISRYYSGADLSKLKRGEIEYFLFLDELRKADPQAFTKKRE